MRSRWLLTGIVLALCLPVAAFAQWSDNFDSYVLGSDLHGQGGWKGWDNTPAAGALVSAAQANSAPHSAAIASTSDLVREFTGATSGMWLFTAWQYVPTGTTGDTYFILLNTYADGGPYNWSTEIQYLNGTITNDGDGSTLPAIHDQWVEIRVEIDLDADTQDIFYGGSLLASTSWSGGLLPPGLTEIGAVDLFSNGAGTVYYDDMSLESLTSVPIETTSWGQIKSQYAD